MNFCDVVTHFLPTASETIERIRQDKKRAPQRAKMVLGYLERRVFAPKLSAQQVYEACDIRDRSFSTFFRNLFGLSPKRYIETCRIEVAEKLIRQTPVNIQWLASLLGYSNLKIFSNAFLRQTGYRPLHYRKRCRAKATPLIESEGSSELALIVELRKAIAGQLQLADAYRLANRLRTIYPELNPSCSILSPATRNFYL